VPEVIADGVTGFVVDNVEQEVTAVGRVQRLDRRDCRGVFEERFDAACMAGDYLQVYRRLETGGSERVRSAPPAPELLAPATRLGLDRRRPS
jgi:hypothetical protein